MRRLKHRKRRLQKIDTRDPDKHAKTLKLLCERGLKTRRLLPLSSEAAQKNLCRSIPAYILAT